MQTSRLAVSKGENLSCNLKSGSVLTSQPNCKCCKLYAFARHSINKTNSENKLTNPDNPSMKCPVNNMTGRIRCESLIAGLNTDGASGFYHFFLIRPIVRLPHPLSFIWEKIRGPRDEGGCPQPLITWIFDAVPQLSQMILFYEYFPN